MDQKNYSWGRTYGANETLIKPKQINELIEGGWRNDPRLTLARGLSRSYGDSCLNDGGLVIDMGDLRRMLHFDPEKGLIRCEAGVTIAELIEVFLPRGWFPPVVPGTKFVTVGGAIANDIHGKNHHKRGTFGCHVTQLELLRSNGEILTCTPNQNEQLFSATIGGLGLTGVILTAEIKMIPVMSAHIAVENIALRNVDDFFIQSEQADADYEYTVAWIDTTAPNEEIGRGILMRGRHALGSLEDLRHFSFDFTKPLSIPFHTPINLISKPAIHAFNQLYGWWGKRNLSRKLSKIDPYFFPLDRLSNWNTMYGPNGFLQYQFVVPPSNRDIVRRVLTECRQRGFCSFLSVLKNFGSLRSPGMISFPMEGPTLTIDFAWGGKRLLHFLDDLDEIVHAAGGRIYPAKDMRLNKNRFSASYAQLNKFKDWIDPKFSSDFWRRMS